jgi:hypothetical protein
MLGLKTCEKFAKRGLPIDQKCAIINNERQTKGGKKMAKEKQYVFSTRATEEGLSRLNELKAEKGIGWDALVIDAVCVHYGLERLAMALPKASSSWIRTNNLAVNSYYKILTDDH